MRWNFQAACALRLASATIGCTALTSCLIFPAPEVSEISESKLAFIEPGITSREVLEVALLSEDVFLAHDSEPYVIYAEYRSSFGAGAVTGQGMLYGTVDDYLVVEYDESDRVVRFDRLSREGECTSYGLCVSGGSARNQSEAYRRDPESLVVFAPIRDDEALKEFATTAGVCSVYAYTDGKGACESEPVNILNWVEGSLLNQPTRADTEGYLHWSVAVAPDASVAGTLVAQPITAGVVAQEHDYECADGGVFVIEISLDGCGIGQLSIDFSPSSVGEGAEAIRSRRLILGR